VDAISNLSVASEKPAEPEKKATKKAHPSKYTAGQKVYYKSSSYVGMAQIVKAHLDDNLEPFYTIKVQGREKQTDDAHLSAKSPLQEEIEEMLLTLSEEQKKLVKDFIQSPKVTQHQPASAADSTVSETPSAEATPKTPTAVPAGTSEASGAPPPAPPSLQHPANQGGLSSSNPSLSAASSSMSQGGLSGGIPSPESAKQSVSVASSMHGSSVASGAGSSVSGTGGMASVPAQQVPQAPVSAAPFQQPQAIAGSGPTPVPQTQTQQQPASATPQTSMPHPQTTSQPLATTSSQGPSAASMQAGAMAGPTSNGMAGQGMMAPQSTMGMVNSSGGGGGFIPSPPAEIKQEAAQVNGLPTPPLVSGPNPLPMAPQQLQFNQQQLHPHMQVAQGLPQQAQMQQQGHPGPNDAPMSPISPGGNPFDKY
jgi:hypothetical protein